MLTVVVVKVPTIAMIQRLVEVVVEVVFKVVFEVVVVCISLAGWRWIECLLDARGYSHSPLR
jgi:hypothetical protein